MQSVYPSLFYVLARLSSVLLAVCCLTVSPQARAIPLEQADLLYSALGYLESKSDGRFGPVDDAGMRQELTQLLVENGLDGVHGHIMVVNLATQGVEWGVPSVMPSVFGTLPVQQTYELQWLETSVYRVAVQNFWFTAPDGQRHEYRILVALPKT